MRRINGKRVEDFIGFVQSGHSFYLFTEKEKEEVEKDWGDVDGAICMDMDKLPKRFACSDSLRFIQTYDGFKNFVRQFAKKVVFVGFTFDMDGMKGNEPYWMNAEITVDGAVVLTVND